MLTIEVDNSINFEPVQKSIDNFDSYNQTNFDSFESSNTVQNNSSLNVFNNFEFLDVPKYKVERKNEDVEIIDL